ncbi:IgA-specific metalloendopeptidase [Neisseria gonorrhoeae]|uniref:IgA-specific metalloendopeptidase n=1 Tax=Neisseria gonorrhoeae TaxID=485 RepID=A0A378VZL0_NEIGO|nr:IgA-specific metalloendopeptidase [Neisseria gonorrhoeae]
MARFNKFVTEVAPIAPTDAGGGLDTYKDKNRFSSFVRIGAGRQLVYEKGFIIKKEMKKATICAIFHKPIVMPLQVRLIKILILTKQ